MHYNTFPIIQQNQIQRDSSKFINYNENTLHAATNPGQSVETPAQENHDEWTNQQNPPSTKMYQLSSMGREPPNLNAPHL